jgi:tRNA(fMet)-specific endonuclease VapC
VAVIVADTDVLIDALHGKDAGAQVDRALRTGALATTAVTAFELESGARSEQARAAVRLLLDAVPILALDEESAARAAAVRRALEGRGLGIGMADYLIAGICLARDAALLTRNTTHMERVPGLTVLRT